jgi:hypothetical protein
MRDLENIDLDLLDLVTGGCNGGGQAQPPPQPEAPPIESSTNPGGYPGFIGIGHFQPAAPMGPGAGGIMAAPISRADVDDPPVEETAELADGEPGSMVCGVVPPSGDASDPIASLGSFGLPFGQATADFSFAELPAAPSDHFEVAFDGAGAIGG